MVQIGVGKEGHGVTCFLITTRRSGSPGSAPVKRYWGGTPIAGKRTKDGANKTNHERKATHYAREDRDPRGADRPTRS